MDARTMYAISEIAKLGLTVYLGYMRQAGMTDAQIDAAYQSAKEAMLARDPDNLPS